jgi:hypothetical protein
MATRARAKDSLPVIYLDVADIVEHPLHRLGLHGWSWVAAALAIGIAAAAVLLGGTRFALSRRAGHR